MWVPDSQVGLVVLQAPEPRQVKHEVRWLESKHSDDEEPPTDSGLPETGNDETKERK
jgi:hypothetical protein